MENLLENILNEFNPIHDFDDIKINVLDLEKSAGYNLKRQLENIGYFTYGTVKSLARGGILGGITIPSALSALGYLDNPQHSLPNLIFTSIVSGTLVDWSQFSIRFFLRYYEANPLSD